jgi:hypothetical protein
MQFDFNLQNNHPYGTDEIIGRKRSKEMVCSFARSWQKLKPEELLQTTGAS